MYFTVTILTVSEVSVTPSHPVRRNRRRRLDNGGDVEATPIAPTFLVRAMPGPGVAPYWRTHAERT
jgi:hypothetical protein